MVAKRLRKQAARATPGLPERGEGWIHRQRRRGLGAVTQKVNVVLPNSTRGHYLKLKQARAALHIELRSSVREDRARRKRKSVARHIRATQRENGFRGFLRSAIDSGAITLPGWRRYFRAAMRRGMIG